MAKIYVSSTYSDLKEYREKVYHKLRELQHDVIAMEDYVASDQRPLDRCLKDVARSDLYIGVFAWRYGYIPPQNNPEHKSITELEYRKAVETGKPRLIFLLEEQTAWPPHDVDQTTGEGDQGKHIRELRTELKQQLLISLFHSPDQLAGLVAAAVTLWEKEQTKREVLDRRNQSLIEAASMQKAMFDDASQFAEKNVYPDQCDFVSDDLRAASKSIQELLVVITRLPITAGPLRFHLSKTLYHAEELASELTQLVIAFRPICRSGSRQTATKKNQIHLKLQELAQSLESSNRMLEQLTDSVQGEKTAVNPVIQLFSSTSAITSPDPVSPVPPAPAIPASTLIDFPNINTTQLREIMFSRFKFDPDDFKLLCIDMGTDYESLKEGGLELKISHLINYCISHNTYEALKQRLRSKFSDLQGQI